MTFVDQRIATVGFEPVVEDLYRDIHKAIRVELFAVTTDAGRLDPSDGPGRMALAAHVDSVVQFLVDHAEHEDGAVQPVLEVELPRLAEQVAREHHALESRMLELRALGAAAVAAPVSEARNQVHRLYRELASFTSDYLAHQDIEERVIMPALEAAIGWEQCVAIHQQIVGAIPAAEMAKVLALMIPAMNLDDRSDLLGG